MKATRFMKFMNFSPADDSIWCISQAHVDLIVNKSKKSLQLVFCHGGCDQ